MVAPHPADAAPAGRGLPRRHQRLDRPRCAATPAKLPGEFAALGVPLPDWTLRDTPAIGVFLARTMPVGRRRRARQRPRAAGARARAASASCCRCARPGGSPPCRAATARSPRSRAARAKQERRAFVRSRRSSRAAPARRAGRRRPTASQAASLRRCPRTAAPTCGRSSGRRRRAQVPDGQAQARKRRCAALPAPEGPAPPTCSTARSSASRSPSCSWSSSSHSPAQDMRGVSAAGVPVVGIGHNGRVAWGFTSGLSDENDLYAEKLDRAPRATASRARTRTMDCRDEGFEYRAPPTDLPDAARAARPSRLARHADRAHLPHRPRAGPGARRRASPTRAATRSGAASWRRSSGSARSTTPRHREARTRRHAAGHLERERDRGRRPRRTSATGTPASTRCARGLRRAPALPRHRRGRVARPAAAAPDAARDQPAPGLPLQLEQHALGGLDQRRRRVARAEAGALHRSGWLGAWCAWSRGARATPRSRAIDRSNGTIAQQRPLFGKRLRRARAGPRGRGRARCSTR